MYSSNVTKVIDYSPSPINYTYLATKTSIWIGYTESRKFHFKTPKHSK